MGKRVLSLYVDDDLVAMAKSKGINISSFFREILRAYFKSEDNDEELTNKEKLIRSEANNALLSNELNEKSVECERYIRKIRELKNDLENLKEKGRRKEDQRKRNFIDLSRNVGTFH